MTNLQQPSPADEHERQIRTQLRDLEARLVTEYGNGGGDNVRAVLASVHERFAAASVRTFLPVLIERAARTELANSGSRPG